MKYIHFVVLHIQNNCAKFQRILPWINLTCFPFYSTHNRGLSKFIGNKKSLQEPNAIDIKLF